MNPIKARIVQADVPNFSGRVYPRAELEAALKVVEDSKQNRLFGTLGMPVGTGVDLSEICAAVGNFEFDDEGFLVGEVVLLETPKGKIFRAMLDKGLKFDYRIAGFGNIGDDGVVSNFRFISIGIVPEGQGT